MDAFLDEVEASVPALRRYARGLVGDADRADDLVQDCLERAIRKRGLFRPVGPVKAWLFRILVNLHRNQIRARRRQGEVVALDTLSVEPAVAPAQPGRIALDEMARAIDALAPEYREALLLVVLDGMNYAEAAHVLDVPLGTLMSRLARARAHLRTVAYGPTEPRLRSVK